MASLTVRQLDEKLKTLLRLRAARNGRSMEDEIRVILQAAAEAVRPRHAGDDPRRSRASDSRRSAPSDASRATAAHSAHHRRRHRRL